MKKRVLAVVILMALAFSLVPGPVLAEGEGEGGWYQGDISPADSALELWLEEHPLTPTEPFGDCDDPDELGPNMASAIGEPDSIQSYLQHAATYVSGPYYSALLTAQNNCTGMQRQDILRIAYSQVGYHEGSNGDCSGNGITSGNANEYSYYFTGSAAAWCAHFISWCARMANIPVSIIKTTGWAGLDGNRFGSYSAYSPSNIRPGDIINQGGNHVGLVYSISGNTLTTIEGNNGDSVQVVTYNLSTGYRTDNSGVHITHYYSPNYTNGWKTINGYTYYVNTDGSHYTGWLNYDGRYYYLDPYTNGRMFTGWHQIGGKWYHFHESDAPIGAMSVGMISDGTNWLYYHSDTYPTSAQHYGWLTLNGNRYYFDSAGHRVKGWQTIGGRRYYFNQVDEPLGAALKGWFQDGGYWYFFNRTDDPIGAMCTGWVFLSAENGWFYFDSLGHLVTGWRQINGNLYYFNRVDSPLGKMCTGWVYTDGHWYYFNKTDDPVGARFNGWLYWDNAWYYFKPGTGYAGNGSSEDGAMATGWYDHANGTYYFGTDGRRVSGLQTIGGAKYYFNEGGDYPGTLYTGWLYFDNAWHYFDAALNGAMLVNTTKVIDGVSYTFDSSGAVVS